MAEPSASGSESESAAAHGEREGGEGDYEI